MSVRGADIDGEASAGKASAGVGRESGLYCRYRERER